ncbi:AAA family ATPase [Gemmata sp. G18]|uniref:AAA family ATPase n=1 Tax=Gemmata palustris TaxID=2822762 RepID=A0ABS5BMF9_9BACT|nr:AAA family ATPase [Gemmata palustris]MBP3954895.1 AAA family ATPase [Gemmata palustris]
MKAVPGGSVPLNEIFGRDLLITELWRALETNSLRLEAERRIGKTSILRKMESQPANGWEAVFMDVENVHSADEFAERVCEKVHERLTGWKKQGKRFLGMLGLLGGTHVGPIKFPDKKARPDGYWKKLLASAVEDLVEQQAATQKRVVFFFDEMPWMLSAIADPKRDGEQTAMEVLDVLRSLRQSPTTGAGFRMVLCGSIGLHHVLGVLRAGGYRNQPVNDMQLVEVPPLEPAVAADLAGRLLTGEGLQFAPEVPAHIATETGGFPYYIHKVVADLRLRGAAVTTASAAGMVQQLLTQEHDPCNFRHFRDRIDGYYPKQDKVALALLDHAAAATAPLALAELLNVGKSAGASDDERVRDLIRLLSIDHYLSRDTKGRYTFRHTLLQRWWKIERGIN